MLGPAADLLLLLACLLANACSYPLRAISRFCSLCHCADLEMVRLPVPVLLAALQLALALAQTSVAQDAAAQTFHHKPKPPRKCIGTTERPVRQIKLPSGEIFCLRLPRFLKNPELDVLGTKKFVRTWGDTCGLYSIVFSTFVPQGAGPPAHIHYAGEQHTY